ncbi:MULTISPECIES: hypothetical protein [Campylobacter]|uniref:hypothetical protein n=1 Tax=Campylobacter TaxID=194 RepID=UPI0022EAB835|nr:MULTISPECIES: hypothetical protein [Campylobacter]MDL0101291.1 hypothetical protein [Campylobacter felis]MDL0104136.1 hypothetical protein [Campylobacter felis]MDL0109388.1 hypothetical protein [Campylobacter felis]
MAYLFKNNPRVKIDSPSFSFSDEEWSRIKTFAEFEEVSIAKFVNSALKDYLKELKCDTQKQKTQKEN